MLLKAGYTPIAAPLHTDTERQGFSSPGTLQKCWCKTATSGVALTDVPPPQDSHKKLQGWDKTLPQTQPPTSTAAPHVPNPISKKRRGS